MDRQNQTQHLVLCCCHIKKWIIEISLQFHTAEQQIIDSFAEKTMTNLITKVAAKGTTKKPAPRSAKKKWQSAAKVKLTTADMKKLHELTSFSFACDTPLQVTRNSFKISGLIRFWMGIKIKKLPYIVKILAAAKIFWNLSKLPMDEGDFVDFLHVLGIQDLFHVYFSCFCVDASVTCSDVCGAYILIAL